MEAVVEAVKFGENGVMTAAQEVLFQELANGYWKQAQEERIEELKVIAQNLVFEAKVKALLMGLM